MIFDTKQHYKMYKKGKYWAFAAITLATVSSLISNDTTVHADTLNSEANTAKNASNGYQDSPQKTNEQLNQGSTESSALSKTSINPTINANTAANNSTNSGDNQLLQLIKPLAIILLLQAILLTKAQRLMRL